MKMLNLCVLQHLYNFQTYFGKGTLHSDHQNLYQRSLNNVPIIFGFLRSFTRISKYTRNYHFYCKYFVWANTESHCGDSQIFPNKGIGNFVEFRVFKHFFFFQNKKFCLRANQGNSAFGNGFNIVLTFKNTYLYPFTLSNFKISKPGWILFSEGFGPQCAGWTHPNS